MDGFIPNRDARTFGWLTPSSYETISSIGASCRSAGFTSQRDGFFCPFGWLNRSSYEAVSSIGASCRPAGF
ncbi:hypothetical protein, partial [Mycetohabitans sp. B3]|uniref:hypothetical protein n=1 Tax=Mycetohabitans sp. B3 TaxID=2841841 RepID=UPI001F439931